MEETPCGFCNVMSMKERGGGERVQRRCVKTNKKKKGIGG